VWTWFVWQGALIFSMTCFVIDFLGLLGGVSIFFQKVRQFTGF
jgi:hypothetical protein